MVPYRIGQIVRLVTGQQVGRVDIVRGKGRVLPRPGFLPTRFQGLPCQKSWKRDFVYLHTHTNTEREKEREKERRNKRQQVGELFASKCGQRTTTKHSVLVHHSCQPCLFLYEPAPVSRYCCLACWSASFAAGLSKSASHG